MPSAPRPRRTYAALLGALLVVVTGLVALPPAVAAEAPVVVTVPPADRSVPRATFLHGDADGWVVTVESSADEGQELFRSSWWTAGRPSVPTTRWERDEPVVEAFTAGERSVRRLQDYRRVLSRVVHSGEEDEVVVPDGSAYLGATQDGVVVQASPGGAVSLLPWESPETPVAVAGEVRGRLGTSVFTSAEGTRDAHGLLLVAHDELGRMTGLVLVDTQAHQAWRLADGELAHHALGPDAVVWRAVTETGVELRTVRRPRAGDPAPRPQDVTSRSAEGLDDRWPTTPHLMPVGDDVLVWPDYGYRSWREGPHDLLAVAPDGTVRTVAEGVSSVLPAGDGRVRLVAGPAADHRVEVVDVATGAAQPELVVPPVPATASAVALDGRRLLVGDDSGPGSAVRDLAVEGTTLEGVRVSGGDPLALPAQHLRRCDDHGPLTSCSLVAGSGAVAVRGSETTTVLDADGRTWSTPTSSADGDGLRAVDGPFLLSQSWWGGSVLRDVRSGERLPSRGRAALLDGVLHSVSELDGRVDVRDLRTGRADVLDLGCRPEHDGVEAAGPWIGACGRLLDRSGRSGQLEVDGGYPTVLGDGFLVRRTEALLEWAPLASPTATTTEALAWQPLGEAAPGTGVAVTRTGDLPSVAWVGADGRARVAALPVAPGSLPPRPSGAPSAPPAPTGVRVQPGDGSLVVRWDAGPASARAHRVRGTGWPAGARAAVRPDGRSAEVTGLVNGRSTTVEVVAVNATGESPAVAATATPLSLIPPPPRDVRATVDRLTSQVTVTWSWTPSPSAQPASSFTVLVGSAEVRLPGTARSASLVVPAAQRTTAYVGAVTAGGGGESAVSAPFDVPGVDRRAPTAAMRPVPPVATTSTVTLGLSGADDRKLDRYQVRWRRAATGKALGAWEQHPSWTALRTGRVDVTGLAEGWTYCFSVRSADHAGNWSPWSGATCTTRPLDDRRLSTGKGTWARASGTAYAAGTVTRSRTTLSTLTLGRVRADAAWLVATSCPTCGRAYVLIGHSVVGDVDLRARTTTNQRLFRLHLSEPHSGTLNIRHHGGGDLLVDGVVLRSY